MIKETPLREKVYRFIRKEMQNGKLLPGQSINMDEMSRRLGISKTPLRDALIQLESDGFIEIVPRRGFKVKQLTIIDIKNIYTIIGALEATTVADVFDKIGPLHISKMEKLNAEMITAVHEGDFEAYYRKNLSFHNVFLNLSGNTELLKVITPMKQRLYDFPRRSYIRKWELNNCEEHQHFIDFIKRGNSKAAAKEMKDIHWSFTVQEKFIRKFYSLVAEQIKSDLNQQKNGKSNGPYVAKGAI
jgi:DNA-binding GntR family transcriptional regulator